MRQIGYTIKVEETRSYLYVPLCSIVPFKRTFFSLPATQKVISIRVSFAFIFRGTTHRIHNTHTLPYRMVYSFNQANWIYAWNIAMILSWRVCLCECDLFHYVIRPFPFINWILMYIACSLVWHRFLMKEISDEQSGSIDSSFSSYVRLDFLFFPAVGSLFPWCHFHSLSIQHVRKKHRT